MVEVLFSDLSICQNITHTARAVMGLTVSLFSTTVMLESVAPLGSQKKLRQNFAGVVYEVTLNIRDKNE